MIKSLKMAEKLKGIKENCCDVRGNYSGNLYSGMHRFVSQKEVKLLDIYVSNDKESVNIPGTEFQGLLNSCRRRPREGTGS
jgi:hypothetical protein